MSLISVYSKNSNFRPKCTLTLHSDMLGDVKNSNFADMYSQKDKGMPNTITLPSFYLSEMPSLSFSSDIDESNGAALANSLTEFSEGKRKGVSFGEIIQNNSMDGGGYVPSMVMGPSSFRVCKGAKKLQLGLKTRIMYDETKTPDTQTYNDLLFKLMKLSLPASASELSAEQLVKACENFLKGIGGTVLDTYANIGGIDVGSTFDAIKDVAGIYANVGRAILEEGEDFTKIKNEINSQKDRLKANSSAVGESLTTFVNSVIKDYIYREFITIKITRNGCELLNSYNDIKKYKFILRDFSVSQSNQLYGDTLSPIYMDFDLNLESLGVVVTDTI